MDNSDFGPCLTVVSNLEVRKCLTSSYAVGLNAVTHNVHEYWLLVQWIMDSIKSGHRNCQEFFLPQKEIVIAFSAMDNGHHQS